MLFAAPTFAYGPIDDNIYFPAVAQGQHGNNNNVCHKINNEQFKQYTNAKINGTAGLALNFCSVGSGLAENGCDTALGGSRQCSITGSDLRGLQLNSTDFPSNSQSGGGISYCTAGQAINVGNNGTNQYGAIALYNTCTLTTSSTFSEYVFRSIELGGDAKLVLSAGDYWVDTLQINGSAQIELLGDARIFVRNSVGLTNGSVNQVGNNNLTLVVYSDINLNGATNINGFVYSDARLQMNASSIINGRVTARYLEMNSSATINARSRINQQLDLQFGKATSTSVTFEHVFSSGVTPLVFLMPTISSSNPSGDGPASVFISSVSATGFSWTQRQPPSSSAAVTMPEVHWIAVTPGSYALSDGKRLTAGTVVTNSALNMSSSAWVNQTLDLGLSVRLNQLQTRNNNCWLTSVSQPSANGISLNMDTSEVYTVTGTSRRCQPGNLNTLANETIAYFAIEPGVGTITLSGEPINYQFANALTHSSGSSTRDLATQCTFNTSLTGFGNPPTLVAGKSSRDGGDGGWLRRCNLSATQVSMVNDEDTYGDNERSHLAEDYGFVALEKVAPVEECFTDDFSRSSLGNDWATKVLGSSTPPAINGGRLRITPALGNQATASTYQRLFPAEGNLVTIEFDYYAWSPTSGTGGDGVAVILSDASVTPQPGSFGGSLGYAQRDDDTPGFAGGWIGVGLDEYGNFSNPNEGKIGGPGFRSQSVTLRGSMSANYKYLAGTAANLNPRIDVRSTTTAAPNHKYRIKVDSTSTGQAWVSLDRDVRDGNGYQVLVSRFNARAISGQDSVPADFYLSFTGSTGGANNNHEIDNFKVCAIKSKPIGLQVHHFEFAYSSSPLTCKAEPMQIKACADGNTPCTPFTDPVSAQLSLNPATNGGWYQSGSSVSNVSFINGIASVDLRHNVTTPVKIGVSSSNPATVPGSNTLCRSGVGALSTAACTLSFADSGFLIDMPDKLANKAQNATISAVRKSNDNLECLPTFAGQTKRVDLWSQYISPVATSMFTPTAVSVNSASISGSSLSPSSQNLTFDASGKATIAVNYSDAGKVELNAKYTGVAGTPDEGLVMIGSDPFVSFPVGLCVTPRDSGALCPAGDVSCAVYKKAGESFNLQIAAKAWVIDNDSNYCDNPSTPNYVQSGIALSSQLVAPNPGAQGVVGITSYDQVAATNNLNTVVQSISEVGVFTFSAAPPASYLGSSLYSIPLAKSANIGRFVPDRFLVSEAFVSPACNSFSYMDQLFPMSMTLSALNIAGNITQNYFAPFSFATAKLVGENINNGIDLQSRLSSLPIVSASWVKGEASLDNSYRANFSRVTPNVLTNLYQDGPFELLDIGVQVLDNDPHPNGINSYVASPDMDAATTGNCVNCTAKKITTQKLRHGRVVMDNTYGPETEILRMPTRAEYWNGSSWVLNSDDSCTIVNASLASQTDDINLGYNFEPDLVAGQSIERSGSMPKFQAGQFDLLWRAITTSGALYRGQVTAPLDVPSWLEWYWNWNDVTPTLLSDPRASAYFGRYRGHDRIIYWREVD
ncbi:DUF6701 domain-containing protein [Shewanella glacialipiscicola]|uniref:DUF6701 domain-containing protein n=1 Tax=Shewanella glacialipiscicola TaxID=614069 RepID=UPI003D796569